ncbi:MAG: alanine racemase [Minisyncoccia bacterium]
MIKSVNIKKKLRTWIEIDEKAIKSNYKTFRKIAKGMKLMGVVKSNAYGHGLLTISSILQNLAVDFLGVDSIVEASALRENGIRKPILVLGFTLPDRVKEAIKNRVSITVSDFESLNKLRKSKEKINVHVKVDTGMHRQGFFLEEIPKVIELIKVSKNIKLEGIYTHFSSAKDPDDKTQTELQVKKFQIAVDFFKEARFKNFITHSQSTSGAILISNKMDMLRIGIGIYGLWPSKKIEEYYKNKVILKPVLTWKSIISQIKNVPKGSGVGYDLTEKLKRDSKIAIIPIGYWHGYSRSLSSKGVVIIGNKFCKVLGRVSMDMIVVDVTDVKNAKIFDEVILLGRSGSLSVLVNELAEVSGTTNYEFVTRLNPLIERIVI